MATPVDLPGWVQGIFHGPTPSWRDTGINSCWEMDNQSSLEMNTLTGYSILVLNPEQTCIRALQNGLFNTHKHTYMCNNNTCNNNCRRIGHEFERELVDMGTYRWGREE